MLTLTDFIKNSFNNPFAPKPKPPVGQTVTPEGQTSQVRSVFTGAEYNEASRLAHTQDDVDFDHTSHHHTIGDGQFQAAPGKDTNDRLNALEASGVWNDAVLQNGWENYGSSYATAAYMKKNGIVYLKGLIRYGTITSGTQLFVLPVGFRPAEFRIFPSITDLMNTNVASSHTHSVYNISGRVDIRSNGVVSIAAGNNGFISFDAISFPAEL